MSGNAGHGKKFNLLEDMPEAEFVNGEWTCRVDWKRQYDLKCIEVDDLQTEVAALKAALETAENVNGNLAADQCCVSGGLTSDEFGNQHCAILQLRDAAADRASKYAKMLDSTEQRVADLKSAGHRLAMELECLLMDTKDSEFLSRWNDPCSRAIDVWKKLFVYNGPRLGD